MIVNAAEKGNIFQYWDEFQEQKTEDVAMFMNKIKVVLGKLTFLSKTYKIFEISTINFLDDVSQEIIKNKKYS